MEVSKIRFRLTSALCAGLVAASVLLPGMSAIAADPLFSPQALERAMLDLYCQFPGQDPAACPQDKQPPHADFDSNPADPNAPSNPQSPGLSANDKSIWALEIFDQASQLDTDGFNDVITHMAADYRQHPEHRLALELVLSSISVMHSADVNGGKDDHTADAVRERLREELTNIRQRNTVITVMDDVLLAFTLAYAFEFGRGIVSGGRTLWETGGEGLTKLQKFKNVGRMVIDSDKFAKDIVKKKKLLVFAAGVGLGLADAAIQAFQTFKIDPRHVLEPVQGDIVHSDGVQAASERDELRGMMKDTPDELKMRGQAYRLRMAVVDKDVSGIQSEMEHLYTVAAQFRPQMDPIAQDLTEIRKNIAQLGLKLDGMEIRGGLN